MRYIQNFVVDVNPNSTLDIHQNEAGCSATPPALVGMNESTTDVINVTIGLFHDVRNNYLDCGTLIWHQNGYRIETMLSSTTQTTLMPFRII
jgi:hypothetical protein